MMQIKRSNDRLLIACAASIFFLVAGFLIFLVQGLPAGDLDDWDKIILAKELPWETFTSSFLTPWSQSQNWAGQIDRYDEIQYKRIILPILLKLSQQLFGQSFFAMYALTKVFFFAGSVTLVFIFLAQAVPWALAFIGALCFLFVPAHFSHALWIADPATISYFFLFLGILFFLLIQKNIRSHGTKAQFINLLAALFLASWVGVKAKETMLVLPLIVFIWSLLTFRSWKIHPKRYLLLNLAMGFIAFQIVPIMHLTANASPAVQFNLNTISRLFFFNYNCGYEDEVRSALFSWDHVFPVSVFRTLGFFLLWSIVGAFALYISRRVLLRDHSAPHFLDSDIVRISFLWLAIELPFLGMFQPDPRYFSGTMAPILILTCRLFYCALSGAKKPVFFIGAIALIFSVGFYVYENVQNAVSLRLVVGRKMNYFLESARLIYKDLNPTSTADDFKVGEFYCAVKRGPGKPNSIDRYVYYAHLGFDSWNKVAPGKDSFQDFLAKSKFGYRYYLTFEQHDVSNVHEVRLIGAVDGINHESFLEKMVYRKKKKRPASLAIYGSP
jgi:hypothetical protein